MLSPNSIRHSISFMFAKPILDPNSCCNLEASFNNFRVRDLSL